MAVVIGYGTKIVGSFFPGADGAKTVCAVSAQWSTNPNTQRMYCLGSISPAIMVAKPTQSLSVTLYSENGGGIPERSIAASASCSDVVDNIEAGLSVAICGSTAGSFVYSNWCIQQYQYSKEEAQSVGQETWTLNRWMTQADVNNPDINVLEPTYVIRGISEGQGTIPYNILGIVFDTASLVYGSSGNVQGGQIGKYYENVSGVATAVGGVTATAGQTGNSSASIPLMPLWL